MQFKSQPDLQNQKTMHTVDFNQSHKSLGVKSENTNNFQTFWESSQYKVHKKVLILTTEKHFFKNNCYSYDFNHLF